jgi:hypothetical protein
MLNTTQTMPHWAERKLTVAGVEFTITMGQEDEGCFMVGITDDDPSGEYIDESEHATLEGARTQFTNPPIDRIERWIRDRKQFNILN